MNQGIFPKVSAYSLAYLDAKNVFNVSSVITNGQDKIIHEIEDVKT